MDTSASTRTPGPPPATSSPRVRRRLGQLLTGVLTGALVVALVVVGVHSASPLWLDEALSVNIARLGVPQLLAALRQDGSPPLYYLLLHAWIGLFGTGDTAVRLLSVVFWLVTIPVMYLAGRRLRSTATGIAASVLVVACPFAIRYATETRMYALVMLLTALGVLAVQRAWEQPTPARLGTVSLLSGLLSLTHYWTLFLLLPAEALLLAHAGRGRWRVPSARIAVAVPVGGVLFLPWLPTFLFQAAHTGTPWAPRPGWHDVTDTLRLWAGPGTIGLVLMVVLLVPALAALTRRSGRVLLVLGLGALALGLVVSRVEGAGYALRYSAAVLVPVLLAVAVGVSALPRVAAAAVLPVAAGLALAVALLSPLLGSRTQAGATAALLRANLGPGDVVVYCPDQLGPAVDRLLPGGVDEVVYPTAAAPQRIDWVDYAKRNAAASPTSFARSVDRRTTSAVWLVRADGYRTFGDQCAQLDQELGSLRGGRRAWQTPSGTGEAEYLIGYAARAGSG